jgi:hypothetical protein
MIATLILACLAGSFALARFYGFAAAASALGTSWVTFAWFPQVLSTAAPIACAVIALLLVAGLLRERRRKTS